jgi:hypothetical protein
MKIYLKAEKFSSKESAHIFFLSAQNLITKDINLSLLFKGFL